MRKPCAKPKIIYSKYESAKKTAIAALCESQTYCYLYKNEKGNYDIAWEYSEIPPQATYVEFIH